MGRENEVFFLNECMNATNMVSSYTHSQAFEVTSMRPMIRIKRGKVLRAYSSVKRVLLIIQAQHSSLKYYGFVDYSCVQ